MKEKSLAELTDDTARHAGKIEAGQPLGLLPKDSVAYRLYASNEPSFVLGIVEDSLSFFRTVFCVMSENENHDRLEEDGLGGFVWLLDLVQHLVGEVKESVHP